MKFVTLRVLLKFPFTSTKIDLALENECPEVICAIPTKGVRFPDAPVFFL